MNAPTSPETMNAMYVAVGTSIATLITALAAWVSGHRKGSSRDKGNKSQLEEIKALVTELRDETRREVALLNRRVDSANNMLTGSPEGDGPNGIRQKCNDHEERIRDLERTPTTKGPHDVGLFAPPVRAG